MAVTLSARVESFFLGGKLNMVIQGYNVSVSSQRTFMSVQSTTVSAAQGLNTAQHAGNTGQEVNAGKIPEQNAKKQGQNQDGNSQGQNQNGQGQNVNDQGQNKKVTNQGQNQNGQGQNTNNHDQKNGDIFKSMFENAREETIDRLAKGSRLSRTANTANTKGHKKPTNPLELRSMLSQMIYEILTGRFPKQALKPHQHIENFKGGPGYDISSFFGGAFDLEAVQRPQGVTFLHFESFQYESETVSYQASGIVHTADGKTINVDINMNMSREFVSLMNFSGTGSTLVDPLVINYGGTAASLTGEKFMFDLTMDGSMDSISIPGEGSGFLAVDWNGDGIINDGSELFGPNTGCGFSELRKYDTDGNGWIDENDEIFDKLVVWRRDKDGNDTVYSLKELGIGAIFLGDISTEYSFKSETNETLGVMRSTSFFIKQCGGAGTLSHIDMAM